MRHLLIPTLLLFAGCGGLDRSNPFDPLSAPDESA